jgi:ribosome-associated protein
MISEHDYDDEETEFGPSKSQIKRDCQRLTDLGDEILKLKPEDIRSLDMPDELEEAVTTALKIKSRSGLKRQRQFIGKLLRLIDNEDIEAQVRKIQHRHDTNTAAFRRLEKWRDRLIDNDKEALSEVIAFFPDIDRQYTNQLMRTAHQERKQEKTPVAARKLFKYLRQLDEQRSD